MMKKKTEVAVPPATAPEAQSDARVVALESKFEDLNEKVGLVISSFNNLTSKLDQVITGFSTAPARAPEKPAENPRIEFGAEQNFFPMKFRKIIDRVLGSDFVATLDEASGADCILKVYVPERWDCRRGDEKELLSFDIRAGLVHRATDIADVEMWCSLFASNIKKFYPNFAPNGV